MEPQIKPQPMTREKAHAIIKRLVAESQETLRHMEETFDTDPGIQAALAELRKERKQKEQNQSNGNV